MIYGWDKKYKIKPVIGGDFDYYNITFPLNKSGTITNTITKTMTNTITKGEDKEKEILGIIENNPFLSAEQIAEMIGLSTIGVRYHLTNLKKKESSTKSAKLNYKKIIPISLAVLLLISITITIFTSLSYLESLRIIFGSVYVLFLPGLIISYLFFPKTKEFESESKEKGTIDWIERIALSFALSIAIVPLVVFYLNLIGIKISLLNSSLTIFGIIIISLGILYFKNKKLFGLNFIK